MPGKSFVVIDGDLRLLVTPDSGWYVASSLDIRGLNTQGKTIEEAIANAHDAAAMLAKERAAILGEIKSAKKRLLSGKMPSKIKAANAAQTLAAVVPKYDDIAPTLVNAICHDLGIPPPKEPRPTTRRKQASPPPRSAASPGRRNTARHKNAAGDRR